MESGIIYTFNDGCGVEGSIDGCGGVKSQGLRVWRLIEVQYEVSLFMWFFCFCVRVCRFWNTLASAESALLFPLERS